MGSKGAIEEIEALCGGAMHRLWKNVAADEIDLTAPTVKTVGFLIAENRARVDTYKMQMKRRSPDMYSTIFYKKANVSDSNKAEEVYLYKTEDEAKNYMDMFREDGSNLYDRISVVNEETNTVLHLMLFDSNGKLSKYLSQGAFVRLAAGYRSAGEEKYVFAITNINDRTLRCEITCLNSKLTLQPREYVDVNMIDALGEGITVEDILTAPTVKTVGAVRSGE